MRDFQDGTTNTIMIGEREGSNDKDGTLRPATFQHVNRAFWGLGPTPGYVMSSGYHPPNPPFTNDGTLQSPFSSMHSGGVQICMADGSVRFINDNIDSATEDAINAIPDIRNAGKRAAVYGTWQALCDINDGMIVGEF